MHLFPRTKQESIKRISYIMKKYRAEQKACKPKLSNFKPNPFHSTKSRKKNAHKEPHSSFQNKPLKIQI